MTPFRRWIESKCKYSTQWGACNVSSSARSASDLGVLLNLSPVSFPRCVPAVVTTFESFVFIPPPPFFREPGEETRSRTLVAVWCRHRARSPSPLPLPCRPSSSSSSTCTSRRHCPLPCRPCHRARFRHHTAVAFFLVCVFHHVYVCFRFSLCLFLCSSFPLVHNTQG